MAGETIRYLGNPPSLAIEQQHVGAILRSLNDLGSYPEVFEHRLFWLTQAHSQRGWHLGGDL